MKPFSQILLFPQSARNTHERTHSNARTFVCLECQKSFVTKASLIRHLRIHTGEAPFQCQYCGRCFKEHGTLSRHLKHKSKFTQMMTFWLVDMLQCLICMIEWINTQQMKGYS